MQVRSQQLPNQIQVLLSIALPGNRVKDEMGDQGFGKLSCDRLGGCQISGQRNVVNITNPQQRLHIGFVRLGIEWIDQKNNSSHIAFSYFSGNLGIAPLQSR
jgi:hypothetical protein